MKDDKQKESTVQDLIEKFEQSNNKQLSGKNNKEAKALIKQLDQFVNEMTTENKKINIGSHRSAEEGSKKQSEQGNNNKQPLEKNDQELENLIKQFEQNNSEIKKGTEKINEFHTNKDKNILQGIKDSLRKFSQNSNSVGKIISDTANVVKQQINKKVDSVGKNIDSKANMAKQQINKKVDKLRGR